MVDYPLYMQTRLDSVNTLSALKKMPLAALHQISAFADKQAKYVGLC
jgi:hypothetical protein